LILSLDKSKTNGTLITPWFKLIVDNFLPKWWNHISDLRSCEDHKTIHRLWCHHICSFQGYTTEECRIVTILCAV